jgi:hypothetical protein
MHADVLCACQEEVRLGEGGSGVKGARNAETGELCKPSRQCTTCTPKRCDIGGRGVRERGAGASGRRDLRLVFAHGRAHAHLHANALFACQREVRAGPFIVPLALGEGKEGCCSVLQHVGEKRRHGLYVKRGSASGRAQLGATRHVGWAERGTVWRWAEAPTRRDICSQQLRHTRSFRGTFDMCGGSSNDH